MTKQELIKRIADDLDASKTLIASVLNSLGAVAAQELGRGGHVPMPGLGKLIANPVKAHTGRNPKTGETFAIPAGYQVSFRTGKPLKDALRDEAGM